MSKIIMSSDRAWTIIRFLAPRDGGQAAIAEQVRERFSLQSGLTA
jgi:hypothetical protein